MCDVLSAGDSPARNPVIDSFLAISRGALGGSGRLPGAARVALTQVFTVSMPAYCALAALACVAGRSTRHGPGSLGLDDQAVGSSTRVQANDLQIRREVSQLMKRRFA